ncbi:hypothetical protein [Bradyrhizobium valentinum]|uniref:hypothetical protein n=1 Tax=Bradyrhizobium valentinum TaxID=1518501 RepID=UPI00070F724D|nr:hypothetical protein [Bradyrhizobium valentinum]KRQ89848.1 hypothetical protein CQ10_37620 [Bradyrhizobium valentinum]
MPELSDECGGEITVLIDGRLALRKALTFGADHIVRSLTAYSPGRHTGEQLCVGDRIRKTGREYGPVDVIFIGKQTIDGDTAKVEPGIAKRPGLLQLTYVAKTGASDPGQHSIRAGLRFRKCRCTIRKSGHRFSKEIMHKQERLKPCALIVDANYGD